MSQMFGILSFAKLVGAEGQAWAALQVCVWVADGASPASPGLGPGPSPLIFQYSHDLGDKPDNISGMWLWEGRGSRMEE